MTDVKCQQCGTGMKKTTHAKSSLGLQFVGLILFIVGFVLLFFIPIGTIFGVILMIVAYGMGYKRLKVWLCPSCGYYFERA